VKPGDTVKQVILLSIFLILSTVTIISADFNAEIDNDFNIVAGNSEILNLTLTSDEKATVHLSYNITPDDIGIQIIFSDNHFTFKGTKIIEIDIATHNLLAPDNYVISIDYSYEIEQPTGGSGGSGTVIVGGGDTDDSTEESTEDDNQTDNQTDKLDDTDDTDDSINEGEEEEKKDDDGRDGILQFILSIRLILLILIVIGICILIAWSIIRRRKDNNE